MFTRNKQPDKDKLLKNSSGGLSFVELMVSIFILSALFIFCLPFFVTSKYATTKEGMIIKATQTSQGIIDRLKKSAHSYVSGDWYYNSLESVYGTPRDAAVNAAFFRDTDFKEDTSYIFIQGVNTGSPPPDNVAKKVVVHLEWYESHGGKAQLKEFTNTSYIARPAISFDRDPSAAEPITTFTTTTSSTSSTSSTSTTTTTSSRTTSTSTTSTSSTSTSSTRTTSTSSTRTTTTSTSSTRTTSTSSTRTTSTSSTRTTTTSTSSTRTTSTSSTSTRTTSTSSTRTTSSSSTSTTSTSSTSRRTTSTVTTTTSSFEEER